MRRFVGPDPSLPRDAGIRQIPTVEYWLCDRNRNHMVVVSILHES